MTDNNDIPSENSADDNIDTLRTAINEIDEEILHLLNRRFSVAKEIGRIKSQSGQPVTDHERERRLLQRQCLLNNRGILGNTALLKIYSDIIAASRGIQKKLIGERPESNDLDIYAVIGDPVSHSLSPVMHNSAFAVVGYNGVYLAWRVTDIASAMTGIRSLGIKGLSITIPHKVSAMNFLDDIDEMAAKIGAVNTVVNQQDKLIGYNTDCPGAIQALLEKTTIKGKDVVIIGAGGAARAIGFGILAEGGRLTIANRTQKKGELLAGDLGAEFRPLDEFQTSACQILINTTPVGMTPRADTMPVPADALASEMVVMDIVYNPLETRLLKEAANKGCVTVDGVSMFVYQGVKQFELWTGREAPVDIMRMVVLEALE